MTLWRRIFHRRSDRIDRMAIATKRVSDDAVNQAKQQAIEIEHLIEQLQQQRASE